MTKKKDINRIAKATAKKLLAIVCQYYGIRYIKQLAASAQLSSWRYFIHEEVQQIACLVLQRHCAGEPEDLQVALKELGLDWSSVFLWLNAKKARRQLAEDYVFRRSWENIEEIIVSTLIDNKSGGVQPYVPFMEWKEAGYITKKRKTIKGKAK